ncbi:hypothetical protein ACQJ2W_023010, partial [Pantoea agglomerans]|uniref:hypothetical protein n=1 Tax=Enterobacter agglomerans TaxID=549 RepID=UPI003EE97899
INRPISGNVAEPDIRFTALIFVIICLLPDMDKLIVQDLFCPVPASHQPQNDPIEAGLQNAIKLLKSCFIADGYLIH